MSECFVGAGKVIIFSSFLAEPCEIWCFFYIVLVFIITSVGMY